jgi:hypothetical protein
MAKRNYRKSSKKIQPAVETLTFYLKTVDPGTPSGTGEVTPGQTTYYCDLSQVASLANRRFYRQGLNWAVGGMRFNSTNVVTVGGSTLVQPDAPEGAITIQKLPNTWIFSNAWEKGFRAWQKMNMKAQEDAPSIKPKFLDFKIFMDSLHHGAKAGVAANILPAVANTDFTSPVIGYSDATPGEWIYSKFVVPNSDSATGGIQNREVIAVGASYPGAGASGLGAVSLIEGYAASRALPNIVDPNLPGDAFDAEGSAPQNWLTALFNEGTQQDDQVLSDMVENNEVPYPFENDTAGNNDTMYPGGANQLDGLQLHAIENITGSTIGGVTYVKGGNFPCGLIRIDVFNTDTVYEQLNILQIDLVPGSHRGYLAEPMTDM